MKDTISYSDFQKLDLRIGEIRAAERVVGSEKLVRLKVGLGNPCATAEALGGTRSTGSGNNIGTRQIVAGIGKQYAPEELLGRKIVVLVNLEPKEIVGIESQGMLLAASTEEGPILLTVREEAASGSEVR